VTYGTPANISNKTCRIFASSEVDSLWQNGLMRLENRAAEVDLRGRPLSCHVSHVWNDTLKRCETVLRIQMDRKSGIFCLNIFISHDGEAWIDLDTCRCSRELHLSGCMKACRWPASAMKT
jgi:hypothetical protein